MIGYVARRLGHAVFVVLAVATLTFVLLHLAPGDPNTALGQLLPPEIAAQRARNLGLDQPIHIQYLRYLGNLVRGDLGHSYARQGLPVRDLLRTAIPNTLVLALAALVIDFTLGITIGMVQARRAGRVLDRALSFATLSLYSVPAFWLGIIALRLFGEALGWFPAGGMHNLGLYPLLTPFERLVDLLQHLALPALTLGLIGAATTARYQRAALLEVVRQDYVRAARAKGLQERLVWLRHALRNALLPTITLFGLSLPILLSGAVLTETIFDWPGMGRLSYQAVRARDYDVATGAAVLAASMVVLGNLVADLLYRLADPRIRETA